MSLFRAPRGVAEAMEKIMIDVLWDGADGDHRSHWVAWDQVRRPKERGGLGIGNICMRNKALPRKWWWIISTEGVVMEEDCG